MSQLNSWTGTHKSSPSTPMASPTVIETRFRTPSLHDRVAFHWQRITNHEGSLFFEEPIYPEVSTSPATGGLATLIHPHSPLKNATQVPHDNPVLRGRYLQVRCTLGPLTVVLHNIYAPAAFQERASYFEELPRDFPPHALHIVGGDFNCTLNKDLDSLRPSTSTMAGTLQLEQWMHSLSLVDLFRRQNPLGTSRLPHLPRTPQVKKLPSAAALKMSNANSCSELHETNTHGVTIIPGIVSPHPLPSSNQDGGSGVSNVSTPNPRAEVEVDFDPNSVPGDQSASRSTSASPGAPLAGVPGGVNLSGEALTQEGEPLGPCACGGCFPGLQLESIPSEGGEKTGSMLALEATRAPPMGTPCGSVYFPPGASSEGRGRYPDLGSRRSNGVPQSPCCGDGMDSPSTPVTGGLAPAFLVTNGTEPNGRGRRKISRGRGYGLWRRRGKDSSETEALTDEGNTQIHSEVDGSGDINGQEKPCDTPGKVIHEEQSTNKDNEQSNQDTVDKSVAQGNGVVDPPSAADKAQGDQEQQNAEKANAWTQKASGKESASSKKDSKQGNAPKGAKHRNIGAHAIADDDIARCEAMADAFYKDSGDMDAFIENILLTPQSQVYELTVKLGEGYKDWSEKIICDQFVKENPGSLWGSKFPNILIHKKNPQTIVISSYNLSTCVEMGGTTFRLGGKDFLVPKYSRYGNNYYVTFNKVSHPSMAKAIVKKMAALTKSVIAAFNPTAGQNIKSPHLRVIFKSSAPPAVLVPKSGDALREITITDPSGQPFVVVFQHKIAALNKKLPPSIASRRAEAKAEKAKAKATKAEAKSPPSEEKEPEHDGDDHDQDPGTHAEGNADSSEASGDRQDEQPQPTATSHNSDVDMSGDSDPPGPDNNGQDKQQEDVEMSTNEPPAPAPPNEQPMNSLDLQLVTGYRSGPAPKRTLPSSPRLDPLPTSNRFHILEEDDVELSFEDFAVPRIVLEDSSAPRPKKTKGKAKKQRLNKSAAAHLELAKKIIRDKKVEGSITECQRILRDDPQLVAHAEGSCQGVLTAKQIHQRQAMHPLFELKGASHGGGTGSQRIQIFVESAVEISSNNVERMWRKVAWQFFEVTCSFLEGCRRVDIVENDCQWTQSTSHL
ncbi:hypothetical protein Ae201684P_017266 [Aphanomyces euteiches]|nr:hypothetical protein Ae201684P_017266 [Aphanomyces euteiches]